MTKWLASVQSVDEATTLMDVLPDIIDMKNPAQGALGALSIEVVAEIVSCVAGQSLTSATIGDLKQPDLIIPAIQKMAETGVDYVKIGLFNTPTAESDLAKIAPEIRQLTTPVIAVLFADDLSPVNLMQLKNAGFKGVMIDTAYKNGLSLLDHLSIEALAAFVDEAKSYALLTGLAGALKISDIDLLTPLDADYLGFRSALCGDRQRTQQLDKDQALLVQQCLVSSSAMASTS